ncbi:MAG: hypothetical protein RsTaC01_0376 [Candidatus Paraimprobicoccus trichonymphae]|uniref:Virulence-associated E family protein n=1 Tax=Candidatus Paraimprobicoccus trichonymphae TaxID=3033793 RepID=A0AA48I454_9FIRM|nr:MAG: hypothetical protein RsTaC01_0376 [Candidatus Paraimprobicoccus trichonymphae]
MKFSNLFDKGDISEYNSESEADQALCNFLAFYCGGDFTEIDQRFCISRLYRSKATINKAITGCRGAYYEPKRKINNHTTTNTAVKNSAAVSTIETADTSNVYNVSKKKNKKLVLKIGKQEFEHFSIEALSAYLIHKHISVRYNIMSRGVEIDGVDSKENQETLTNDLPIILFNELKDKISGCNVERVTNFLSVISGRNRYNPVLEMLKKHKWDKRDRIYELYEILNISDTDSLSRVLIFKWLCQAISMAKNDIKNPYGADGILVLQGKQGIGKTTFVRKIAIISKFCKLGQYIDPRDKDTLRRCVSAWIIELGEIETTFKSDLERLKSFITSEIDEYRLPYGRCDQVLARRSVMVGTCNSDRFLIDPTGSRRFWTVPIEKIDLKRLEKFNSLQLWLQIEEEFGKNRQGFRLTTQERELLEQRNSKHEKLLRGQAEVEDVLSKTNPSLVYKDVTVSQFKECHSEFKS